MVVSKVTNYRMSQAIKYVSLTMPDSMLHVNNFVPQCLPYKLSVGSLDLVIFEASRVIIAQTKHVPYKDLIQANFKKQGFNL